VVADCDHQSEGIATCDPWKWLALRHQVGAADESSHMHFPSTAC
jgi:hypothetical protein